MLFQILVENRKFLYFPAFEHVSRKNLNSITGRAIYLFSFPNWRRRILRSHHLVLPGFGNPIMVIAIAIIRDNRSDKMTDWNNFINYYAHNFRDKYVTLVLCLNRHNQKGKPNFLYYKRIFYVNNFDYWQLFPHTHRNMRVAQLLKFSFTLIFGWFESDQFKLRYFLFK